MKITVNGKPFEISAGTTLQELLLEKKWQLVPMLIRIDSAEIKPADYRSTVLRENQDIRIIPQFGGG